MEDKVYGYVYLITNKINGKRYVGQTVQTIKERFTGHVSKSKYIKINRTAIMNAIKKYGKENFTIEEIAIAYSKKELKFIEGIYIMV